MLWQLLPPQFLHEKALLLARLGRHYEVLRVYVHELGDLGLAERYCHRAHATVAADGVTAAANDAEEGLGDEPTAGSGGHRKGGGPVVVGGADAALTAELVQHACTTVYQLLLKVVLTPPLTPPTHPDAVARRRAEQAAGLDAAVALAERCLLDADRLDPVAFLAMLPHDVPLAKVHKYLCGALESATCKHRNLQVVYQLLRVREVHLRTSPPSQSETQWQ